MTTQEGALEITGVGFTLGETIFEGGFFADVSGERVHVRDLSDDEKKSAIAYLQAQRAKIGADAVKAKETRYGFGDAWTRYIDISYPVCILANKVVTLCRYGWNSVLERTFA